MKRSIGPKTIVYPAPAFVIGTYDHSGKPNAMTAAWAGICCSSPPCIAVSLRKATYTYGNILEKQAFTVNIAPEEMVKEVDYFGIVSGESEDKFSVTGLTPLKGEYVDAPFIGEFPLVVECALINHMEIGSHTQFIGEVKDIKVEESVLGENDTLLTEKIKPVIFTPGDRSYYALGRFLGRGFSIGRDVRKAGK